MLFYVQVVMVDSGKLGLFTIAGFSIVLCQVLSLFGYGVGIRN